MTINTLKLFMGWVFVASLGFIQTAIFAQKGPMSGMNFKFFYGAEAFTHPDKIFQIQSNSADFTEPDTIGKYGTSEGSFECFDKNNCFSSSKGYKRYQKLVFVYGDKTILSEAFEPAGFISDYEVRMSEKGITVSNQTPFFYRNTQFPGYLKNLFITILTEVLFSFIILRIFNYSNTKAFLQFLIPANLVSITLFWWVLMPLLNSASGYFVGVAVMIAIESGIIWFGIKKEIPFGKTASIVFFVNLMGIVAGGFLKYMASLGIATRFFR